MFSRNVYLSHQGHVFVRICPYYLLLTAISFVHVLKSGRIYSVVHDFEREKYASVLACYWADRLPRTEFKHTIDMKYSEFSTPPITRVLSTTITDKCIYAIFILNIDGKGWVRNC